MTRRLLSAMDGRSRLRTGGWAVAFQPNFANLQSDRDGRDHGSPVIPAAGVIPPPLTLLPGPSHTGILSRTLQLPATIDR
jgi:hypothetical protein